MTVQAVPFGRGLEALGVRHALRMKELFTLVAFVQIGLVFGRTAHATYALVVEKFAYANVAIPITLGYGFQCGLEAIRVKTTIAIVTQQELVLVVVAIANLTNDLHDGFVPSDVFVQFDDHNGQLRARCGILNKSTPHFQIISAFLVQFDFDRVLLDRFDELLFGSVEFVLKVDIAVVFLASERIL